MSLKTKEQLRMARAGLGWSQERLAEAAGVSLPTIKRLEPGEGALQLRLDTLNRLERALQDAGVIFTNGDEPGVKMRARG